MANYMDKNLQVPNYSGVNIQIFNPAVNMPQSANSTQAPNSQSLPVNTQAQYQALPQPVSEYQALPTEQVTPSPWATIPNGSVFNNNNQVNNNIQYPQQSAQMLPQYMPLPYQYPYPQYFPQPQPVAETNFANEDKKINTQTEKKKVVVLTDNYIMSLENCLNDPNREVRLQAARDVVNRFEEDSSRFDDPALNALLNKMLQDPQGSIRGIALSLVCTGAAQGNDYTAQLLNMMKTNTANKEDALQATEALLRMATRTETIDVPVKQQVPIKEGKDGYSS